MPTYAYSGTSSTISSAESQEPAVEDTASSESAAPEHPHSEVEDFEKVVELLFGEHGKLETQLNRNLALTLVGGLGVLFAAFAAAFLFDDDPHLATEAIVLFVIVIVLNMALYLVFLRSLRSYRRQRRTYEELAELVREIAPLYMPKMSLVRRAELKIRLSNIQIYDPQSYR